MKGYIIIIFAVSVFFTITSLIYLSAEDKEDRRSLARNIGSAFGLFAATAHIAYLIYNYGFDWLQ